jgi:hypothetical protein
MVPAPCASNNLMNHVTYVYEISSGGCFYIPLLVMCFTSFETEVTEKRVLDGKKWTGMMREMT